MTPFYQHLSGVPGFNAATSIDKVGAYATAAVAAAFGAHTLVQITKREVVKRRDRASAEQDSQKDGSP
jgi:hypothetical protein